MKATIEFDLDNPDDVERYNLYNNATNMYSCLHEFNQKLRSMHKYEGIEAAELYRELLYEYLREYNIRL